MQDRETKAPRGTKLVAPGFAVQGKPERTIHNGKPYLIQTCYEFEAGRWEGFVTMRACA